MSSCYQYVSGFYDHLQHDLNIIGMNLTSACHQALTKSQGTLFLIVTSILNLISICRSLITIITDGGI